MAPIKARERLTTLFHQSSAIYSFYNERLFAKFAIVFKVILPSFRHDKQEYIFSSSNFTGKIVRLISAHCVNQYIFYPTKNTALKNSIHTEILQELDFIQSTLFWHGSQIFSEHKNFLEVKITNGEEINFMKLRSLHK